MHAAAPPSLVAAALAALRQVPPTHALIFGLVLAAVSTVWLWLTTNQLAAGLALTAIAFYVLVYTLILKRRTAQNSTTNGQ